MDVRDCPDELRNRLKEDGVAALAEVLAEEREQTVRLVSTSFEQRLTEECGKLRGDMSGMRNEIRDIRVEMRECKTDLRSDMQTLRIELRADFQTAIANTRADLLKWCFVFWIGQVAAVVGLASVIQ